MFKTNQGIPYGDTSFHSLETVGGISVWDKFPFLGAGVLVGY